MWRASFLIAICFLAGCTTTPAEPAYLSETEYEATMKAARNPSDPFAEERMYSDILARRDLSQEQLIRTQFMRAIIRGTTASNLAGSIADYEDLAKRLAPEHELFKRITDNLAYAVAQRGHIEGRIAKGLRGQRPNEYLEDLLLMGRFEEAKVLVKNGSVSPSDLQVEKFAQRGLMCEGPGYGGFRWGYSNTGYHAVGWCDTKALD